LRRAQHIVFSDACTQLKDLIAAPCVHGALHLVLWNPLSYEQSVMPKRPAVLSPSHQRKAERPERFSLHPPGTRAARVQDAADGDFGSSTQFSLELRQQMAVLLEVFVFGERRTHLWLPRLCFARFPAPMALHTRTMPTNSRYRLSNSARVSLARRS